MAAIPGEFTVMPKYRLYKLDGAGSISSAEWIDAGSDEDAVRQARELELVGPCEIWSGDRRVARVSPEQ